MNSPDLPYYRIIVFTTSFCQTVTFITRIEWDSERDRERQRVNMAYNDSCPMLNSTIALFEALTHTYKALWWRPCDVIGNQQECDDLPIWWSDNGHVSSSLWFPCCSIPVCLVTKTQRGTCKVPRLTAWQSRGENFNQESERSML